MKLYPFQEKLYSDLQNLSAQHEVVCLAGTTGLGKTEIASKFIIDRPGKRFLILAHGQKTLRTNFIERLRGKKELRGLLYEMDKGSKTTEANEHDIVVALPHTVFRVLDKLNSFDYLIIDEAHEFYMSEKKAKMYPAILSWHKGKQLLLTGSHYKLEVPKVWFSRQEALQSFRDDGAAVIDDVHVRMKHIFASLAEDCYTENMDIHETIKMPSSAALIAEILSGKGKLPAVISKHNISGAKDLCEQLDALLKFKGKVRCSVSGGEDANSEEVAAFKRGEFPILVVVRRATLGFDYESLVTFIDASYSCNITRIEQSIGRVARVHPEGKTKHYYKFTTPDHTDQHHLAMCAVMALGHGDIYRSWDGIYKSAKIMPPSPTAVKDLIELKAEMLYVQKRNQELRKECEKEDEVCSPAPRTAGEGNIIVDEFVAPKTKSKKEPVAEGGELRVPNSKRAPLMFETFGKFQSIYDVNEVTTLKNFIAQMAMETGTTNVSAPDLKKGQLIKIALNGGDRPSEDTGLGRSLSSYTTPSHAMYDQSFDVEIRKIRPEWFRARRVRCFFEDVQEFYTKTGKWPCRDSSDTYERQLSNRLKTVCARNGKGFNVAANAWARERGYGSMETRIKGCRTKNSRAVHCVTNGSTYTSAVEAARALGLFRSGVSKVCSGEQTQTKGFRFEYVKEEE